MEKDHSTGYGKETATDSLRSKAAGAAAEAKSAVKEMEDLAREAKDQIKSDAFEGFDESRRVVSEALADVQEKGKRLAEKAKVWGSEAKKSALDAARELKGKRGSTAVVVLAALAVGVLIGRYLVPTSD